jgi:hypothetical protein
MKAIIFCIFKKTYRTVTAYTDFDNQNFGIEECFQLKRRNENNKDNLDNFLVTVMAEPMHPN